MSPIITLLLILFIILYSLIIIIELIKSKSIKRFLIQFIPLIIFVLILNIITGFPEKSAAQSFGGGVSSEAAIGLMFICSILGIVANYFFYLDVKFSLREFLKPFLVSPIVFLPLVGSVQGITHLESMQMVSFAILAFQSGFFWQKVFEKNHE